MVLVKQSNNRNLHSLCDFKLTDSQGRRQEETLIEKCMKRMFKSVMSRATIGGPLCITNVWCDLFVTAEGLVPELRLILATTLSLTEQQ